jgi:hypothetical protein
MSCNVFLKLRVTTSAPGSTAPNKRAAAWHSKIGASDDGADMDKFGFILFDAELRDQIWL